MPRAIRFCAKFDAASWAASSPPATKARLTISTPAAVDAVGIRDRIRSGANASRAPGIMPSAVASERCSSVAPSRSARVRASPAPAPTPKPTAAARPAKPRGPAARKGTVEPTASPSLRPTVCSYPGAASNGRLAAPATDAIFSRAAFSMSSGSSAEAPVAADSSRPIAPGTMPLKVSLTCPSAVVSGAGWADSGNWAMTARATSASLAPSGPSIW